MPKVGGKKYAYNTKGMKAAKKAAKKSGKKISYSKKGTTVDILLHPVKY